MEDNSKLAELVDSVESLRDDVKKAEDTLSGMSDRFRDFLHFYTTQSHTIDRTRSRVIDMDDKLARQGERFDRVEEMLKRILDNQKGASE